jgi:hypothetical protein
MVPNPLAVARITLARVTCFSAALRSRVIASKRRVNKAFAEERERKQTILFPVRLDDVVLQTSEPWARKLRDQRNIGDFTRWKDHDAYRKSFDRLMRDLTVQQTPKAP